MAILRCPYLGGGIELSEGRERHITERHPDLLPLYKHLIQATLLNPDEVRMSARNANARLLSRWYDELRGGKYVVVVVAIVPANSPWIMTAYIARKLMEGKVEWKRD